MLDSLDSIACVAVSLLCCAVAVSQFMASVCDGSDVRSCLTLLTSHLLRMSQCGGGDAGTVDVIDALIPIALTAGAYDVNAALSVCAGLCSPLPVAGPPALLLAVAVLLQHTVPVRVRACVCVHA